MTAILFIQLWTGFHNSFYLPIDRDATVVINTQDKVHCIAQYKTKQKLFRIKCDKNNKNILVYQETTPEYGATISTNNVILKVEGQRNSK